MLAVRLAQRIDAASLAQIRTGERERPLGVFATAIGLLAPEAG